jgi:hypothetical protein
MELDSTATSDRKARHFSEGKKSLSCRPVLCAYQNCPCKPESTLSVGEELFLLSTHRGRMEPIPQQLKGKSANLQPQTQHFCPNTSSGIDLHNRPRLRASLQASLTTFLLDAH